MGPLIPNELISFEWSSIIAIIIGICFGFILEASGFSSSRKLAGVFYGAAIVSLIGLLYMDYLGYVDMSSLYVHPTYLWGAIIGGVIMGIGFVAGGFCPGTSLSAVAIGKIDAIFNVLGIMVGIFIFSESYTLFEPIYNGYYQGNLTLVDSLGVNPYWFVFILTVGAVIIFAASDMIRKRVKKVFY